MTYLREKFITIIYLLIFIHLFDHHHLFAGIPNSAKNGMVVSASELASEVGLKILKNGGNAIDASVAVGFALSVTYPFAGNLGGGGFMVIHFADVKIHQ